MQHLIQKLGWLVLLCLCAHAGFGQSAPFTTTDPVAYSNYVVDEQDKVGREFVGFSNVLISNTDYKTAEARRQEVLKQVELSLRRLRNMAPFAGKTTFRDEAVAVFAAYKDLYVQEYARVAALVATQRNTPAQLEEFYTYQVQAERKMQDIAGRMLRAQRAFAKENKMELVENPAQEQFSRIIKASIYDREANLSYLGVLKADWAWWEAMKARDLKGMETHRTALINAAKTSPISSMGDFEGNTTVKVAAQKLIDFYKGLAEKEYAEIGRLLGQEKRTQADIDRINAIIDAYNTGNQVVTNEYNAASQTMLRSVLN